MQTLLPYVIVLHARLEPFTEMICAGGINVEVGLPAFGDRNGPIHAFLLLLEMNGQDSILLPVVAAVAAALVRRGVNDGRGWGRGRLVRERRGRAETGRLLVDIVGQLGRGVVVGGRLCKRRRRQDHR